MANAEENDEANLAALQERQQLDLIQSLLKQNSSEHVREVLRDQGYTFFRMNPTAVGMNSLTALDLLKTPFFTIEGLSVIPMMGAANNRRMTANVSKKKREVLARSYSYAVGFRYWQDFENKVTMEDHELVNKAKAPPPNMINFWATEIVSFLMFSYATGVDDPTGEHSELALTGNIFRKPLQTFGYSFAVIDGTECDIEVMKDGRPFLFLEGKKSTHLPRHQTTNPDGLWAELCTFGFATHIASTVAVWNNKGREPGQRKPVNRPGPQELNPVIPAVGRPSKMTLALLHDRAIGTTPAVTEFVRVADKIRRELHAGRIEDTDAINLWSGVMQACHYSVAKGRNLSIVVSARMFWFIKLVVSHEEGEEDQFGNCCHVEISNAHPVGSENFLRTLVSFFIMAEADSLLSPVDQREWELALGDQGKGGTSDSTGAAGARESARTGQNQGKSGQSRGNLGQPNTFLRKRKANLDAATSMDCNAIQQTGEEMASTGSSPVSDDEDRPYRHVDEYGLVPWFDQIDHTNSVVLGVGRTGNVTKVKWNNQFVALKTISVRYDDERNVEDVYNHELAVGLALRPLWGKHVPALLFHKPWPTGPLLGYQLGEPLVDDMSKWHEDDFENACETIEKVRDLGWVQEDMRGANFVRLMGPDNVERIAMIDFESLVEVTNL